MAVYDVNVGSRGGGGFERGNKKSHYHHGDLVVAKILNQRERQAST